MLSIPEIQEAILEFFHSRTVASNLEPETDLMEAQAIDSLTVMEFVLHTERLFRIRLEGADVSPRNFRSVQTLAALIAGKSQLLMERCLAGGADAVSLEPLG